MPEPSGPGFTPPYAPAPPAELTPPARQAAADEPRKENIKETIESILVAFILAFVFRAFIVEAFVIPSGSMAPTLLGAHLRFRCDDCGYPFDVNLTISPQSAPLPGSVPPMFSMHCPNCGYKVRRLNERTWQGADPIEVRYGDRILVLKYLYLLQAPSRWDVVVFKEPTRDHSDNFIKRLVGLPGETVMLLDGDVYTRPNNWTGHRDEGWTIQRKPRIVQDALWRVVLDNDFQPRGAANTPWTPPWTIRGAGWTLGDSPAARRIFRFDNPAGEASLTFNPDANDEQPNRSAFPFSDWLPYNETRHQDLNVTETLRPSTDYYPQDRYRDDHIKRWHVSDIEMRFVYDRKSGDGPLRATLTKLGHAFVAEFTPGKVRLLHTPPRGEAREVASAPIPRGHAPIRVEIGNVDHRLTLRVDGAQLIEHPYDPDVRDLLLRHERRQRLRGEAHRNIFERPTAALSASSQVCAITHLSLWRDIYYTPAQGYDLSPPGWNGTPGNLMVLHREGDPMSPELRAGYAPRTHENEYFVLGDNSPLSGDARGWDGFITHVATEDLLTPPGRVPERFMLGKAFFVYWPAGYRPFESAPGLVPNFGEMRFIH